MSAYCCPIADHGPVGMQQLFHTQVNCLGHKLQLEDFVSAIQQDRAPAVNETDGKHAIDIICSIYRSSKSGLPQELPV